MESFIGTEFFTKDALELYENILTQIAYLLTDIPDKEKIITEKDIHRVIDEEFEIDGDVSQEDYVNGLDMAALEIVGDFYKYPKSDQSKRIKAIQEWILSDLDLEGQKLEKGALLFLAFTILFITDDIEETLAMTAEGRGHEKITTDDFKYLTDVDNPVHKLFIRGFKDGNNYFTNFKEELGGNMTDEERKKYFQ